MFPILVIVQIALAELHQQGVQFLAVSIDNRRAWMKEKAGDIGRLTSTGKKLVWHHTLLADRKLRKKNWICYTFF